MQTTHVWPSTAFAWCTVNWFPGLTFCCPSSAAGSPAGRALDGKIIWWRPEGPSTVSLRFRDTPTTWLFSTNKVGSRDWREVLLETTIVLSSEGTSTVWRLVWISTPDWLAVLIDEDFKEGLAERTMVFLSSGGAMTAWCDGGWVDANWVWSLTGRDFWGDITIFLRSEDASMISWFEESFWLS